MLTKKVFFIIWFLGLVSGFTVMISGNTLNFWLSKEKISIETIGIFAFISLPYAINFIWAPIFDSQKLPFLHKIFGKRISWIIVIQLFLSFFVYLISLVDPNKELMWISIYGVIIAFFASTQDTILGALRTEIVDKNKQGEISGTYILGYRIGMILSGSGAIYASEYFSLNFVYKIFSICIAFFPFILILLLRKDFAKNISSSNEEKSFLLKNSNIFLEAKNLIAQILKPIGPPKYILAILVFLIFYRLPDNFIAVMINSFLLHIGYNEFEISTIGKLLGTISATIGGLVASRIMKKKNIYDSLLLFGIFHASVHLLYIVQEIYGKNIYILSVLVIFEGVSGGMVMSAYISLIASLCSGKFRATQYSFLSSMMGLSRSVFPSISGYIVIHFGWVIFYLFIICATIPALILLSYLRK